MSKDYEIDYNSIIKDENGLPEWVTVWKGNVPKWYKLMHTKINAYVLINDKRVYIFSDEGDITMEDDPQYIWEHVLKECKKQWKESQEELYGKWEDQPSDVKAKYYNGIYQGVFENKNSVT